MQHGLNALMRDSLAHRLRQARKSHKWTQEELARRSGVAQANISKIERGSTLTPEGILSLAKALAISPYWLKTGEGSMKDTGSNVDSATNRGRAPLISWGAVGLAGQGTQMFLTESRGEEAIETSADAGLGSFALRVEGDSMVNPMTGGVSFPDGAIIIVDPTRKAKAGDFVVATDPTSKQATLKQLMADGGRWFLKPLNPAYPTTEIDGPVECVVGRVIEVQLRRAL